MGNKHVEYMRSFVVILSLLWLQTQSSLFNALAASPMRRIYSGLELLLLSVTSDHAALKHGFISHLTYLVQLSYLVDRKWNYLSMTDYWLERKLLSLNTYCSSYCRKCSPVFLSETQCMYMCLLTRSSLSETGPKPRDRSCERPFDVWFLLW